MNVVASTPKAPSISTTVTTITPTTAPASNQSIVTKKDEVQMTTKVNNIIVANNALPHGTNCLLALN